MNQYFPITKQELSLIKNNCYHPETDSCDGCELACDEMGCSWMGANALEEEILTRNPYQSETEQKTPDHPLNYATMAILARIGKQAEFKEAWERLENAERNYICGDIYNIVKSACSHPYQSERDKVLDIICEWLRYNDPKGLYHYIKNELRAGE